MTIFIGLIDGLDSRSVEKRGLLSDLQVYSLENDLSGENALYTYRIWPSIYVGENGGRDDEEPYAHWDPDAAPFWENYASKVVYGIDRDPKFKNNTELKEKFRESRGPLDRIEYQLEKYREEAEEALENEFIEVFVLGTKQIDINGHNEGSDERVDKRLSQFCGLFEDIASDDRVDNYLIVSDHGFVNDYYGINDGIDAHAPTATLASDFCSYTEMSEFIENWHGDLEEAHRRQRLRNLGYT